MRAVVAILVLLLLCAPVAWAFDEITIETHDGWMRCVKTKGKWVEVERFVDDVKGIDHFLAEKVQPEIEKGDVRLHEAKELELHWEAKQYKVQLGIGNYLKALVLIEEERLRRGK
mgnify:CR=1 FL=1